MFYINITTRSTYVVYLYMLTFIFNALYQNHLIKSKILKILQNKRIICIRHYQRMDYENVINYNLNFTKPIMTDSVKILLLINDL